MRRVAALMAAGLLVAMAGPVVAQTKSPAARADVFRKLPNWSGYWLTENDETSIGGLSQRAIEAKATGQSGPRAVMSLYGFGAPWNDEGKRRQAEKAKAGGRKAEGWGYPIMMNGAAPIQFMITPEEVLIINAYRDVRHVYTDGRKHPDPDDIWPTVWGDSIGHWEGDTLVIDTIQVKNPNYYFHGAPPLSEEAHYVERIRLVAPGKIENDVTIIDPVTLTGPWKAKVTYQPAKGFDRMISIEYDNDRTGSDEAGQNTIEPATGRK